MELVIVEPLVRVEETQPIKQGLGYRINMLMSRKVARTAEREREGERERGVQQQLEEEEEPIEFVTVFSDVPSFSPLILFISSSILGH
jgi:hypothetical protein